jgi:hypothetical protein
MPCDEKLRLRNLYNAAAEKFASAVNNVNVGRGKTTKEEYDRLRAIVDAARNKRNSAHLDLDRHTREHGC